MLITFLLTSHLKRLLISALIRFENTEKVEGLSKIEFKQLLSLATKESYSIFNGKLYKQVGGVAMGSPLGPTLVNVFLVHFEKSWLQNCASDFKPHYCGRYFDDIFVSFTSAKHVEVFQHFLNGRHADMSFTIESEKQNRMFSFDVQIIGVTFLFTGCNLIQGPQKVILKLINNKLFIITLLPSLMTFS